MTEREQLAKDMLQEIAKDVTKKLPKDFGFCLLAYEFGNKPNKQMLYVSNSNREDVVKAMSEWINTVNNDTYGKDQ